MPADRSHYRTAYFLFSLLLILLPVVGRHFAGGRTVENDPDHTDYEPSQQGIDDHGNYGCNFQSHVLESGVN